MSDFHTKFRDRMSMSGAKPRPGAPPNTRSSSLAVAQNKALKSNSKPKSNKPTLKSQSSLSQSSAPQNAAPPSYSPEQPDQIDYSHLNPSVRIQRASDDEDIDTDVIEEFDDDAHMVEDLPDFENNHSMHEIEEDVHSSSSSRRTSNQQALHPLIQQQQQQPFQAQSSQQHTARSHVERGNDDDNDEVEDMHENMVVTVSAADELDESLNHVQQLTLEEQQRREDEADAQFFAQQQYQQQQQLLQQQQFNQHPPSSQQHPHSPHEPSSLSPTSPPSHSHPSSAATKKPKLSVNDLRQSAANAPRVQVEKFLPAQPPASAVPPPIHPYAAGPGYPGYPVPLSPTAIQHEAQHQLNYEQAAAAMLHPQQSASYHYSQPPPHSAYAHPPDTAPPSMYNSAYNNNNNNYAPNAYPPHTAQAYHSYPVNSVPSTGYAYGAPPTGYSGAPPTAYSGAPPTAYSVAPSAYNAYNNQAQYWQQQGNSPPSHAQHSSIPYDHPNYPPNPSYSSPTHNRHLQPSLKPQKSHSTKSSSPPRSRFSVDPMHIEPLKKGQGKAALQQAAQKLGQYDTSQPRRKPEYTPYKLKDYKELNLDVKLGGLGADVDAQLLKERADKNRAIRQLSMKIREENMKRLVEAPPRPAPIVEKSPTIHDKQKQFAAHVPKPKQREKKAVEDEFTLVPQRIAGSSATAMVIRSRSPDRGQKPDNSNTKEKSNKDKEGNQVKDKKAGDRSQKPPSNAVTNDHLQNMLQQQASRRNAVDDIRKQLGM